MVNGKERPKIAVCRPSQLFYKAVYQLNSSNRVHVLGHIWEFDEKRGYIKHVDRYGTVRCTTCAYLSIYFYNAHIRIDR